MSGLRLGLTALGLNTGSGQPWWPQGAALSYNFNFQQFMHNGADILPGAAFSTARASAGYGERSDGSLVLFAPNEPRITDRGLLVEASGTNLIVRSNELEHSAWTKVGGVTVFDNYAAAPDGTMTASRIVFDADTTSRPEQTVSGLDGGADYTFSVYLRAESGTPTVRIGTSGATPGEYKDVVLSSQWQRYSNAFPAGGAFEFPRVQNITGAAGVIIQSWGFQYEAGLNPSSVIITTTTAAARAADFVSATDMSWLVQGRGTFLVETSRDFLDGVTRPTFTLDDGSTNSRIQGYSPRHTTNTAEYVIHNPGGFVAVFLGGPVYDLNAVRRDIFAWADDDVAFVANGALIGTDTNATMPVGLTDLLIGRNRFNNMFAGRILSLTYWPDRLSNSELQGLTS